MKLFIHGLESSGNSYKARFLKKIFPDILTPTFQGDFQERMKKLNSIASKYSELSIIGSSFGGLMATKFAHENEKKVKKLILLAPALTYGSILTSEIKINTPCIIYHGTNDEVVPLKPTKELALKIFKNLKFIEVADDHFLHKTVKEINWKEILRN